MNDLNLTLTGWVASDPTFVITRGGQGPALCTFRMGQTPRYFDRNAQKSVDSQTEWFTVRVFRDAAFPVAKSIKKGQPVVVGGRLRTNEWIDADKQPRVTLQIDATVVGHDLTRGIASFNRAIVTDGDVQVSERAPESADGDGAPDADGDAPTDEGTAPDLADVEEVEEPRTTLA